MKSAFKKFILPTSYFILVTIAGCSSLRTNVALDTGIQNKVESSTGTVSGKGNSSDKQEPEAVKNMFKPFFIYTDDNSKQNHFAPSGWMGDASDIKFSGSYQVNPRSGKTCLRITYTARGPNEWSGVYWQQPANNWGEKKGGFDLRGAQAITFWARGEKGGEVVSEVKMGGITGKYSDSDIAWEGPIKLTKEWKQYRIDLKEKDLRYINGGFCFTVLKLENPHGCTFYFDEIRYE